MCFISRTLEINDDSFILMSSDASKEISLSQCQNWFKILKIQFKELNKLFWVFILLKIQHLTILCML